MIRAQINERAEIPWWVPIGAPLVIIPMLVALLAFWAPREEERTGVGEPDATRYVEEPVDARSVGGPVELPPDATPGTTLC